MTYIEANSQIWDKRSENSDVWSIPVSKEEVERAREGEWSIVLTPTKPVPANWFPEKLEGKRCFAWQVVEDSRGRYWRLLARM